jgi:hypothetical protein
MHAISVEPIKEEHVSTIVACKLTGDDLASQARRWREVGARAGAGRAEVDDGIRITFRDEAGVEDELRELVAVENVCCAWATWDVAPEEGSLVMHARSRGDGVAALHGMFTGVGE